MNGATFKAALKVGVKRGAGCLGPLCRVDGSRILTYHSVGRRDHEMNVTPEAFAAQMAWLADHYKVVTLQEAVDNPGCGIAITFDDGYLDVFHNAAPALAKLKLPATIFVVAGRVGSILEHDRGKDHAQLMTWDDVAQIREMGFDIGCHTMTHARLSHLTVEDQRAEILESKKILEERLGQPVPTFAYPFGSALDYTAETIEIAREAPFRLAVSNRYGVHREGDNRWECRRIWIDRTDTMDFYRWKVTGRLDALRMLDSGPGIAMRHWLNRVMKV